MTERKVIKIISNVRLLGCIVNDKVAMRKVKSSKSMVWLCCIICEEWYHAPCVGLAEITEKNTEETKYV